MIAQRVEDERRSTADPYELNNIVSQPEQKNLVTRLDHWLTEFRKCRGAGCREVDVAPQR